ncbi:MAG: hypothetical protein ACI9XO_003858 [Paraglaciecola sp.]|jgi:hypothetical protein
MGTLYMKKNNRFASTTNYKNYSKILLQPPSRKGQIGSKNCLSKFPSVPIFSHLEQIINHNRYVCVEFLCHKK